MLSVPNALLACASDAETEDLRSNTKYKALKGIRRRDPALVVFTVVSAGHLLIELVPGDPAVAVLGEQATPEQFTQFRQKHVLDRPPFFFWISERGTFSSSSLARGSQSLH